MYSFPSIFMGSHDIEGLFWYYFFVFCPYCSFQERNNVTNTTNKKSVIFMHWIWSKQTFEIVVKCTNGVGSPATKWQPFYSNCNSTWKMLLFFNKQHLFVSMGNICQFPPWQQKWQHSGQNRTNLWPSETAPWLWILTKLVQ